VDSDPKVTDHLATRGPDSSRERAKGPFDFDRDESSFPWWQGSKKAEYQKFMGHIQVLRLRARRQLNAKKEAPARSSAALLVRNLLDDKDSWRLGDEAAHVYADALEELLPLIAERVEIDAMFTLELDRRHEGVALADVSDSFAKIRAGEVRSF
jgi:hypothetical protein